MGPGRWKPPQATREINACAKGDAFSLSLTTHAKEQMLQRDLTTGDVKHVLKTGFVHGDPEPSSREGYFKYLVEGTSPNSGGRTVGVVVIPDGKCDMKLVTVMWRDP